ncbi:MAG: threonine--tRNA ligase [Actinobacteria bacterium]|uniref:threonine--tRNA ligase n=1 Tax=freshwater metagenome TaxID=449393 RepID=A0A6J6P100_9ZZZZ|nr:threonine--tRNA ligase [Actinomycetota bacterium]
MNVVLPDGKTLELADGASGLDAALAIGPKLAEQAVLIKANGETQDLRAPLPDGATIEILTTRNTADPDALYVLRHSAAHLLAEAVRRLHPGVKVAIGPPIDDGFYYDFEFPSAITEADLEAIENEVKREITEGRTFSREEITADEARERFRAEGEPYKVELVDTAQGAISLYTQTGANGGEFTDLCRGPHLQNAAPIKAFKITGLAGAYWRGDSANTQLTRIYGTAFYKEADLAAYLERMEESRKRDHRRLGVQLDLFHFSELSPGSPFWHPKGMKIWNVLEDLRRRENLARGYVEVRTPQIYDKELWVTSGHWDKYREHMFTFESEERTFSLKPMNCPGHCVLYANGAVSYRDLPIRMSEAGVLHRDELAGALHGLLRVRMFSQDDAHIFCTPEQVEDEVLGCLDFGYSIYEKLGLEIKVELSTRPENKLGTDEEWDAAEGALKAALDRQGLTYSVNEGDGAFYGPKIDLHMLDSLGRGWQIGTVQLDFQLPQRFGLTYQGADNAEHTPVMVHRALIGSFERFIGILIEHFAGAFPFWLAPVQVRIVPVAEVHTAAAHDLAAKLGRYRVEVDDSAETLGKRIRNAELEKIPFVIVYGEKESDDSLAVRERGGGQSTKSLAELQGELAVLAAGA